MAPQSQADLLAKYGRQIRAAKKWRDKEGYDRLWRRMIDMYRGKQFDRLSTEDRIVVNISFSTANIIAPSVAVNYPKITVNARKAETAAQAIVTEAVINYWWKHYQVRPEFRRAVKDFICIGHGWLKTGYKFSDNIAATDQAPAGLGQTPAGSVADTIDGSDPTAETGDTTQTSDATSEIEQSGDDDRPFVERVSPFDMFVDPDATCLEDARWIAQRIRRTVAEVQADKRYSPAGRKNVGVTNPDSVSESSPSRESKNTDIQYVDVWEFYDIPNEKMCVFAEGASDIFLVKPVEMPYTFGHPYVMVRNYDVPDFFYPMGDLEALEPLQKELNETRSQMMNHRRKYARKSLYRTSAFGPAGLEALESDEDNVLIPVDGDEPFERLIAPMPQVMTPPEFYNHSTLITNDANMVTAVSEYQRGTSPDIRKTATEAAITQDAANARAADKLATIEQAIVAVASRLIQLAQTFLDGEHVVRVVGSNGEPAWATFDKDYIEGEFDFEVEAGSTAPINESFRRQMALQMVDALAPFVQLGVVNPGVLAKHVLQFGFGVKNPEDFLQTPPPPQAPPGADPNQPPGPPPPDGGQLGAPVGPMPTGPNGTSVPPQILAALAARTGVSLPNMNPAQQPVGAPA